jgi:hypothetical protein
MHIFAHHQEVLCIQQLVYFVHIIPLTPNGHYSGRTAPLTSRRCILNIQQISVLNILNMLHNLRFSPFKMPFIS